MVLGPNSDGKGSFAVRRSIAGICLLSLASSVAMYAQGSEQAPVPTPEPVKGRLAGEGRNVPPLSGIERPEDRGLRMHTHFIVHIPPGRPAGVAGFTTEEFPPDAIQPVTGDVAETPASLACLYNQVTVASCSETSATTVSTGGSKIIAIVEAYDYPTALADLTAYSSQFGLPAPTLSGLHSAFAVIYAGGTNPGPDPNCAGGNGIYCWAAEAALDIEMAHAAAPEASIVLVEANSSSNADLYAAVTKAIALLTSGGGAGEVSMSWGGAEYSQEVTKDSIFTGTGVVFFASSGDEPGVQYPAASPNVVAVGGTSVSRFTPPLVFHGELTWDQGGGGGSIYEPRPGYQSGLAGIIGNHRGVPDVSAVANPNSGVWVYDSYQTGEAPWNEIGGTSVAAPLWAGFSNAAGTFESSSADELHLMYSFTGRSGAFRDIMNGGCGRHYSYLATTGWDQCTGNGAPVGLNYH
jgi:subtilase family serine protease